MKKVIFFCDYCHFPILGHSVPASVRVWREHEHFKSASELVERHICAKCAEERGL